MRGSALEGDQVKQHGNEWTGGTYKILLKSKDNNWDVET